MSAARTGTLSCPRKYWPSIAKLSWGISGERWVRCWQQRSWRVMAAVFRFSGRACEEWASRRVTVPIATSMPAAMARLGPDDAHQRAVVDAAVAVVVVVAVDVGAC